MDLSCSSRVGLAWQFGPSTQEGNFFSRDPKPMPNDRILVVDDEPAICHVVAEMLRAMNAQVETAISGADALVLIEKQAFDLLITDFHMPVMSGLELIQEVRQKRPDMRIILMSAQEPARIVG